MGFLCVRHAAAGTPPLHSRAPAVSEAEAEDEDEDEEEEEGVVTSPFSCKMLDIVGRRPAEWGRLSWTMAPTSHQRGLRTTRGIPNHF